MTVSKSAHLAINTLASASRRWWRTENRSYNYVYRKISQGKWQEYDPWDLTGRLAANMNIYEGPGGCLVFRTFHGWLRVMLLYPAMEGTLVVYPILQPTTAYWMLRPFFKPTRNGSVDGWKFSLNDEEGNVDLYGANLGIAQELTADHYPHLILNETMIPYPTIEPWGAITKSAEAKTYWGKPPFPTVGSLPNWDTCISHHWA